MQQYVGYMRVQKLSEVTIRDRMEVIARLEAHLAVPVLAASAGLLIAFQATFAHLAPASVDIYTRHLQAFYAWAHRMGLIVEDPAADLPRPIVRRGRPHPTSIDDLRIILACARGSLRTAYILAAFAGFRCGEICRLQGRHISRDSGLPVALVQGKGNKERYVPLLAPVVAEVGYDRGWIITNHEDKPWSPDHLSAKSSTFIHQLGIDTTMHSMRHFFATNVMQMTRDPLLVRDLLGHESLETTQIYTQSDQTNVHGRLADFAAMANGMLNPPHLSVVRA